MHLSESIGEVSRQFFTEVVLPLLEREMPEVAARTAFGIFGLGSEAYGMDDDLSRDHHWGLRVDALMPQDLYAAKRDALLDLIRERVPSTYRGHALRAGHLAGAGVAPD